MLTEINILNLTEIKINKLYIAILILIILGLIFRFGLMKYKVFDVKLRRNKLMIDIGLSFLVAFIMTFSINKEGTDPTYYGICVAIILGYIISTFLKKLPPSGYVESLLLVVNGFFVTSVSLMEFPMVIFASILVIVLSYIILKWNFFSERKSDFWIIVLMCIEAIVLSFFKTNTSFKLFVKVVFSESFLYLINCLVGYLIVWLCGEDTEYYWDEIMGIVDRG